MVVTDPKEAEEHNEKMRLLSKERKKEYDTSRSGANYKTNVNSSSRETIDEPLDSNRELIQNQYEDFKLKHKSKQVHQEHLPGNNSSIKQGSGFDDTKPIDNNYKSPRQRMRER